MREINSTALNYWNATRYSDRTCDEVYAEIERDFLVAKVRFDDSHTIDIQLSEKVRQSGQGHFPTVIRFIEDIANQWQGPELKGTLLIWLEDGLWRNVVPYAERAPLLTFGRLRYDHYSFLIPDPAFIESKGYQEDIEKLRVIDEETPWEKKIDTIFWRGASSGANMQSKELWKSDPRIRLSLFSKEFGNTSAIDAAISKVVEVIDPGRPAELEQLGIVKEYIPFTEFMRYRHQVDADGISCAWISCFLKLASDCTLLKIDSPNIQWYYDRLQPWKHFIPIRDDLADLSSIIAWIENHPVEARATAHNGCTLARELRYEDTVREAGALISSIFHCQFASNDTSSFNNNESVVIRQL